MKKTLSAAFLRLLAFLLALLLVVCTPLAILACCSLRLPEQYGQTYYATMKLKLDRLGDTPGARLVVIGGSSTAFGIDSKIAEAELGMPCVNFGLYAAFGLKVMLDLSLADLHEGDIVVIAPELSSQMYSDYVGYSYLLQALEGRPGMYTRLGGDYVAGFLHALPAYYAEKQRFAREGSPRPEGVYSVGAFDSFGDVVYDRPENIMDGMVAADSLPEIGPELVTDGFAEMINDYVAAASARGASVYFGFCPVNRLAVELTQTDPEGLVEVLAEKLDCPVIASLEDHILDPGYFYDSNLHMNNAGMVCNTVLLVNDIKRIRGEMTITHTEIPEPVTGGEVTDVLSSGTFEGFRYDITAQGAVITGLDEGAMTAEHLSVPASVEGFGVYKIGSDAFAGCAAASIEIPACVSVLGAGLFRDAVNLKEVRLLSEKLPEVGDGFLAGAPQDLAVYVPADLYSDYVTDYFWGRYGQWIKALED